MKETDKIILADIKEQTIEFTSKFNETILEYYLWGGFLPIHRYQESDSKNYQLFASFNNSIHTQLTLGRYCGLFEPNKLFDELYRRLFQFKFSTTQVYISYVNYANTKFSREQTKFLKKRFEEVLVIFKKSQKNKNLTRVGGVPFKADLPVLLGAPAIEVSNDAEFTLNDSLLNLKNNHINLRNDEGYGSFTLWDLFADQSKSKSNEIREKLIRAGNIIVNLNGKDVYVPCRKNTLYEPEALRQALSFDFLNTKIVLTQLEILSMLKKTFYGFDCDLRTLNAAGINQRVVYFRELFKLP